MVDVATFLTPLSVMVEAFCKTSLPPACHPGPQATLSRSEGMTWALCGPWQGFGRARGFSRDAQRHLRAVFPQGPSRAPCHRQMRQQPEALRAFCLPLVQLLATPRCASDALDSSGLPTREAKRRGAGWGCPGWPILAGAPGWAGMTAARSCWRSIRWGGGPVGAVGQHAPKPNRGPRPALPCAVPPTRDCRGGAPSSGALGRGEGL